MTAQLGQHIGTYPFEIQGEKNESGLSCPIKKFKKAEAIGYE